MADIYVQIDVVGLQNFTRVCDLKTLILIFVEYSLGCKYSHSLSCLQHSMFVVNGSSIFSRHLVLTLYLNLEKYFLTAWIAGYLERRKVFPDCMDCHLAVWRGAVHRQDNRGSTLAPWRHV